MLALAALVLFRTVGRDTTHVEYILVKKGWLQPLAFDVVSISFSVFHSGNPQAVFLLSQFALCRCVALEVHRDPNAICAVRLVVEMMPARTQPDGVRLDGEVAVQVDVHCCSLH